MQTTNYHCDESTVVSSDTLTTNAGSCNTIGFNNKRINYSGLTIFLTEAAAKALHAELEKLYPQLVLPLGEGDIDALAERYAEEHAGDVGADGPVEIEHVAERASPTAPTEQAIMDYNSRVVDMVARAAGLIR